MREQSRAEFNAEQFPGEFHFVAHFQTVGGLKYLQFGTVSADTDNFALQSGITKQCICDFVLNDPVGVFHRDKIAVDADDLFSDSFSHSFASMYIKKSYL